MPDVNIIILLAIILVALVLFISGKLRFDIIALCVLATLLLLGLIRPDQAIYGFTNQATATIAAMFVLSAGLVRTGVLQWITSYIDRLAGKKEWRLVLVIMVVAAFLSAFIINTAIVAIFIPIAVVLAQRRRFSSSRVMIPLSFASQFGGVCTLIGTSTNILVNSIAVEKGLRPFGLFEFTPLGLAMAAVGIAYLLITMRWLPKRRGEVEQVDKYRLADYLAEMRVTDKSVLIGETWERSKLCREAKVELTNLFRGDKATARPAGTKIRENDLLLLNGNLDNLIAMQDKCGLELQKNVVVKDQNLSSSEIKLAEVLIPPRSNLIGRTLQSSDYFRRYKATIMAIQRRGKILRERLTDIKLDSGDTLLLQGHKDDVSRLLNSANVIVTNELTELYIRKDRAIIALLLLLMVVILAVFNIVPILVAVLLGAGGMVLGRCITVDEAYQAIDWKVIFLLGGIIPLGLALEQNGAALWIADALRQSLGGSGPLIFLAVLYFVTAVLTETMSNNAAAAILAPIAITLALAMNADPRPFLIAITFAASTSFTTPIGYQTNTMVYAPGGYRFTDFVRIGAPLNLIFLVVAVVLIPLMWPF